MSARPPPARPHIGLNPHLSSFGTSSEWVEDDAWDSASDSESPHPNKSWNASKQQSTAPKNVPGKIARTSSSSSSNLASSYTHIHAPNPSSYPSKPDTPPPNKGGWTLVKTSDDRDQNPPPKDLKDSDVDHDTLAASTTSELTDELVVGDFDDPDVPRGPSLKARESQGSVRGQIDEIIADPLYLIKKQPDPVGVAGPSNSQGRLAINNPSLMRERSIKTNRRHKFISALTRDDADISEIRKLAWNGTPPDLRPAAWQILLGHLPLPPHLRASTLARKREEYASLVEFAFARGREGLDQQIWHQIEIDVPRTRPGMQLWMQAATQRSLERILYVWAIRHPASGYVQGINDLVTPFYQVFLSSYIDSDPELFDPAYLPPNALNAVEADSFWCLSRLLDGIQDNYIHGQPGIHRGVKRIAELVARIDAPLAAHLESENVEFMQFAFRWMNCLLMREISVQNTIRMWDTYLSEGTEAFSQFHLYVCSAFLVKWSQQLREMDFQGIIMFLQSLPTQNWGDHEIEMLLSEAFVLNSIWHNAQSHFGGK